MPHALVPRSPSGILRRKPVVLVPALIEEAGPRARKRFLEFFTAQIRNSHTRKAYWIAVGRFLDGCVAAGLSLESLEPLHLASSIEALGRDVSRPTVKQHLAALKRFFDWLVTGQVLELNPATSVRGPKYVVEKGKTPVLRAEEARKLLDSIDLTTITGLRDRALIALMIYSFARVSAALGMRVEDYFIQGRRGWFRFHEKGGKLHQVPAHHNAEAYLDAYLKAAGIIAQKKSPLFRTIDRTRQLTDRPMDPNDALRMIKRRARNAGIETAIGCHSFRATGITAYLENGGTIENAQAIAGHESPRTTKLYDRTSDEISLDEIERILI